MAAAELRLSLSEEPARDVVAEVLVEQGFEVAASPDVLSVSRSSPDDEVADPDRFDVRLSEVPEGTLAVFAAPIDATEVAAPIGDAVAGEAARLVGARLAQRGLLAVAAPAADALAPIPAAPLSSGPTAPSLAGYPGVPSGDAAVAPGALGEKRTNAVAIVALVLGFVVPVAGIVTGAVALSQIKRTGEKGRGLALGGIVAGGVLTLFIATLVIGTLVFSAFVAAGGGSADPYAPTDEGGVTVAPDEQAPFDPSTLVVGACLDDLPGGFVAADNVVDCAQPHSYEAFGGFDVPDGAYPGDAAIETEALAGCEAAYGGYVGVPYQDSRLDYYYVGPTQQTWEVGDREIFCLLFDPQAEQTVGSLTGSGL
ncbi:DUF4190 domain-containing protein [Microbacterium sp. VKM Ac-2923]|uniref:DUF4190 domain-containing protein n=1 Tax=Microbacterium sp. VKM Ac-2923 TaxID=2929476 RepID=UPI001FB29136|nr:DUF4190 domain-containing protein [Microbacterium sp. VKM Ac-2923]MCJ1706037.1 DUF4190 domain-containing protein [Microbacterium sp. VKM Ac-2923]